MNKNRILVTGGCGFVGRNLIRKLSHENDIWVIDDLSLGQSPDRWLPKNYRKVISRNNYLKYTNNKQNINFVIGDLIDVLREHIDKKENLPHFNKIFHLASIVGGRETIDGDPIKVGKDLAIDSIFFYWLTRLNHQVDSVMYASSSAVYPVMLQKKENYKALKEKFVNFKDYLRLPDMTYGWSKLTGEYLSKLTAQRYSIPIACVRPFSGYGEDQDFSYPIPAIARRVALRENPISVWGTGKQGRDFVHIEDCINAFFVILENIKDGSACNIGSGKLTNFIEVIHTFTKIEGYSPEIKKIVNKPVGTMSRFADISKIKSFDWSPKISNEDGFRRVLSYVKKYRLREKI